MRPLTRLLLFAAAVLVAAPAAAQVDGTYALVQVDGQPLPTASPAEDNVVVQGASFRFQPDGSFTGYVQAGNGHALDSRHDVAGTFTVDGDTLSLTERGHQGQVTFRWTQEDGRLNLVDELGHVWTFARQ
jgi:hypothetical protein